MAKVQTRKSVSLNRQAFERAAAAARSAGVSLSRYTEDALEVAILQEQRAAALAETKPARQAPPVEFNGIVDDEEEAP